MLIAVSGDELAAEAQISAANKRAVEVRAEAAMLVEAVEDRAYSVGLSHFSRSCTLRSYYEWRLF